MIPKKATNPSLQINLWTMFIRPLFDYASLSIITNEVEYIQNILLRKIYGSFKRTIGLRKNTSIQMIENMLGYSPLKLAEEKVVTSVKKWEAYCQNTPFPNVISNFRIYTSSIMLNWETIKSHNLLNLKCDIHKNERITVQHLRERHNIEFSGIEEAISEGLKLRNEFRTPKKEAEAIAIILTASHRARKLYTTLSALVDIKERLKTYERRKKF